ncbi:hypothetical protein ABAC460_23090 [Asticcacaulis sp. AC460]|uniref:hypothetical protein n=1 Tax=Asticcacaulis sp. AC460 TaxID=1282360 RepID=UPI0003C3F60A|nr:hypothetical protein [Asticcacaulis sp. AC460]ESQ86600.1 hypothetical protein ABAC460_23090 [Asticcacaulis sp. AC460]
MIIGDDQLALLRAETVSIVPILYIDTPTPVRAAASFGTFALAGDAVDVTGGTYLGIGEVTGLPSLTSLINGQASRVDLGMSAYGVQGADLAAGLETDSSDLRYAGASIGFLVLDPVDLQPVGTPFWLWTGTIDKCSVSKEQSDSDMGPRTSISISIGSQFVRRRQGNPAYYTDSDQKTRSSDDDFCRNVRGYANETTKPWPV